ncbi:MAG: efflux RND transporter periplasmic adaptor subunit [Verrucomicrobia bacterium]|nr:efflux RND transporter periplasmic adaptor subunit [Verrucomicrobiota bacterium]
MKRPPRSLFIILGIAVVAVVAWRVFRTKQVALPDLQTMAVKRGDVFASISATGTLEPEEVVDIGAQVTGQILSFGNDTAGKTVDYGSQVAAGSLLAKIDDSLYAINKKQTEAQLQQAQSAVLSAEAGLVQNKAKLEQARAQFNQAKKDWERAEKLGPSDSLSRSAFDTYQGVYDAARANVAAAEAACEVATAQIATSKASVMQAQAAIQLADRNLGYCTILSPVTGLVIDRRVDVGQTVVSNMSASSLFLLAKDLQKMEVWVAVNEADIGSIHAGQAVTFTVDTFPGSTFQGRVNKVRLNATMSQNVVTYTVEINTDNADGKLLPYLTASVKFEIDHQQNVLTVPNAALRWRPADKQLAPGVENPFNPKSGTKDAKEGGKAADRKKGRSSVLWVRDPSKQNCVKPVKVRTGISDGVVTEVTPLAEDTVLEDVEVVVGESREGEGAPATETTNPFAPKFPSRGPRR